MRILSHRGMWNEPSEKNTIAAFRRSFENGFGTETDLRDQSGKLVISHDPPLGDCISFEDFLELHAQIDPHLPLALNIKSDGLQKLIANALKAFQVHEYFLFDMSVPDMWSYSKLQLRLYARISELEPEPLLLSACDGIWVDAFERNWLTQNDLLRYTSSGFKACVVSPELHARDKTETWKNLRKWTVPNLSICTDLPYEARDYFGNET